MGALTTALLIGSTVLKTGAEVAGARATARAGRANQRFANQAADDVLARGEEAAEIAEMDLSRLLGAQRTILAAGQGLDVEQGSAKQLRTQTEEFGAEDIATLRLNAAREAWGIRTQARIDRRAANAQATAGYLGAAGTLLGGSVNAWDRYRSIKGPQAARLPRIPTGSTSGYNFSPRG